MSPTTSAFSAFALEPFPTIARDDDLAAAITGVLSAQATDLQDGDVIVVASKVVSIEDLAVRNMVKNGSLARAISDAAWSQLPAHSADARGDHAQGRLRIGFRRPPGNHVHGGPNRRQAADVFICGVHHSETIFVSRSGEGVDRAQILHRGRLGRVPQPAVPDRVVGIEVGGRLVQTLREDNERPGELGRNHHPRGITAEMYWLPHMRLNQEAVRHFGQFQLISRRGSVELRQFLHFGTQHSAPEQLRSVLAQFVYDVVRRR